MRREDVRPLLERAARGLPVPDLADTAWAGGVGVRRRRRRGALALLATVLVVAAAAALLSGTGGGNAEPVPPTVPPTPFGFVPPSGTIAGMDFWMAPPAGSERFLDRVVTPLGDLLRLPDNPPELRVQPVRRIAAVLLAEQSGGHFTPLLLDEDGHWGRADLDLAPISSGPPLSSASVSPDGRLVAFPQPGEMALLDGTTADAYRVKLPWQDVRSVSWLPDSKRVLVSGKDRAYRVLVGSGGDGEQAVTAVSGSSDPAAVTAPYRLEGVAGQASLLQYSFTRGWTVQRTLQLPATSWVGQTFATTDRAARLFLATPLAEVSTPTSQPQIVAGISTTESAPSRLLVLGETPAQKPIDTPTIPVPTTPEIRRPGCCGVLGWYDDHDLLVQVVGRYSAWILAWDVQTGQVRRVTELEVGPIALGPGIHG
ncbi:MAG TPA: hypothetical protein VFT31_00540 [Kribbella sp.]|nr:hypothetical protein [Kribbella sp.]